jgi:hypothetical protein
VEGEIGRNQTPADTLIRLYMYHPFYLRQEG